MRKSNRGKSKMMAEINVVPYIDVMLVLLVIFMVTTPLLNQGVKINLPQASANPIEAKQKEPMIITVDAGGRYYLNIAADPTKPITPDDLSTRVAAELQLGHEQNNERPVLVKGDTDANYGRVISAMVLLQKAGVDNVGLVTTTPDDDKSAHG